RYARDDAGGRRYFLTDHLGSTTALSDSGGNVTARYSYSPYGDSSMTVLQGAAPTNSYQYTGRENDGAGLYYYRARYYSPGMRRFTQEDPLGLGDGPNPYAYVKDGPTMGTDPSGEFFTSVDVACARMPELCWNLLSEMTQARAGLERKLGNDCAANYWEAAADFAEAVRPLVLVAQIVPVRAVVELHHLLPQAKRFKNFFKRAQLDIEDFKIPLDRATHRLKPDGIHTRDGGDWNKVWDRFFEANPNATRDQIIRQLERMRRDFGI
ncbi:RHS repeat-associated protein, partial [Dokdonella fugitiva]